MRGTIIFIFITRPILMFRKIFYTFTFLVICFSSYSQVRHVKGIEMIGAGAGIITDGNNFSISYQKYLDRLFSIKASAMYETVYVKDFKYDLYALYPEGLFTLLSNKKTLFLNLEGGIILGFDRLRSKEIDLDKRKFVIGQTVGLNSEIFLLSNIKLDLTAAQRFFEKNQNEKLGLYISASIIFNI